MGYLVLGIAILLFAFGAWATRGAAKLRSPVVAEGAPYFPPPHARLTRRCSRSQLPDRGTDTPDGVKA